MAQSSPLDTGTLFTSAPRFRIATLTKVDAKQNTDSMVVLRDLISESEPMYPNIGRWFKDKVVTGLRDGERVAYVAFEGERAVASAVLKLGKRAKFCHVKIASDFQDLDLGQMFFTQMTLAARHLASELHFTLPEGLWTSKAPFFESFGFGTPQKANRQYRHGEAELVCSAPLRSVLSHALENLPNLSAKFSPGGFAMRAQLLLSVQPRFCGLILAGVKTVEVRRRFSGKWTGSRVVLYATNPVKALVGEAVAGKVVEGSPAAIWEKYETQIGCTHQEFVGYTADAPLIKAVELEQVIRYVAPVPIDQLSYLLKEELIPPQSYRDMGLDRGDGWSKAASLAALLHGATALVSS